MSTCISREGEYSEHDIANDGTRDGFWCRRCFSLDEEALVAEVERLWGIASRVEAVCNGAEECADTYDVPVYTARETQALMARAFDEGRAVERQFTKLVMDYQHWSHIGSGPPSDLPNPYRPDPTATAAETEENA